MTDREKVNKVRDEIETILKKNKMCLESNRDEMYIHLNNFKDTYIVGHELGDC